MTQPTDQPTDRPAARLCASACAALLALGAGHASAQQWSADLYAGGTQAQGVAAQAATTSVVGNLRWQGSAALGYATVGTPLDANGALWSAAGAAGRWTRSLARRSAVGVDLAADGYGYHDRVSQADGSGLAVRAIGLVSRALGATGAADATRSVELRFGPSEHWFGGPTAGSRGMWEVGGRWSDVERRGWLTADVRAVATDSVDAVWTGAQLTVPLARGRVWLSGGSWVGGLSQLGGEVGGAIEAGPFGELWASFREQTTDPLYGNPKRMSWNVGLSRALGRTESSLPAPDVRAGRVRIRLPRKSVPDADGAPAVAGEFSGWARTPMTRAGGDWVLDLPLGHGVYRFAFVSAAGGWFVPTGYPGRVDDGMGGDVAVLVVP